MEPIVHILLFPFSPFPFHGDKMNSALNLINPQRFHVLIPKVKGVIVLTNEVSVPPSGNKGKREQNTQLRERPWILAEWLFFSPQFSWRTKVWHDGKRPCRLGLELSAIGIRVQASPPPYREKKNLLICNDEWRGMEGAGGGDTKSKQLNERQSDSSVTGKYKKPANLQPTDLWTRWMRKQVLVDVVTKASHSLTLRRRGIIQVWRDDSHDTALRLVGWQGGMWHTWQDHAARSTVATSGPHRVFVEDWPWEFHWAHQMLIHQPYTMVALRAQSQSDWTAGREITGDLQHGPHLQPSWPS